MYDSEISFELAKLAKATGYPQREAQNGGYTATGDWCGDFAMDMINGCECYGIITIGELKAWLRIEHGIHINERMDTIGKDWAFNIHNLRETVFKNVDYFLDEDYDKGLHSILLLALNNILFYKDLAKRYKS